MMTTEQKRILRDMQWIPEEKQDMCGSCDAKLVNGKPKQERSHAQDLRCINWHIEKIMDKLRIKAKE